MAVYNGSRYLEQALAGILNQRFDDFEFLILDDGSRDQTPMILASVKDPRARIIRQERVGLTRSLIRGLSLARGEYIARQDADDISRVDRLGKQFQYLNAHPDVALVGSGVTAINEENCVLRDYIYPSDHNLLVMELERLLTPLPHTTIMFRRRAIVDCGGYREVFPKAQDYDLFLRVIEKYRVGSIPEPLCFLRQSMDSVTFEDGAEEQFQYAVLALISSVMRRQRGIDPLGLPSSKEFLTRYRAWYGSSQYPRVFRSRKIRRQARLAWRNKRFLEAFRSLGAAIVVDPSWAVTRLGLREASAEAAAALAWAHAEISRMI